MHGSERNRDCGKREKKEKKKTDGKRNRLITQHVIDKKKKSDSPKNNRDTYATERAAIQSLSDAIIIRY
jgi:hypothetical protein